MRRKQSYSIGELTVDYIRGGGLDPFTDRFYLDSTNGSDGNSGMSISQAKKTFGAAKGLLTSGKNQVLYMVPGATGAVVTSAQTWDLAATNLIGLGSQRMNNRARIYTSTAGSMTPLMTWSAANCICANVMFSQEGVHATGNAISLYVTGHRNYFENVHLRNTDSTAVADASYRALKLGTIYDTFFKKCQIGETSVPVSSVANRAIEFAGTQGGKYVFEDCIIMHDSGLLGAFFVMPADVGGFTYFRDCLFLCRGTKMTQAFVITASQNDPIILKGCVIYGATALETSDSGLLFGTDTGGAGTGERTVALTG